jgi:hypothetical protein
MTKKKSPTQKMMKEDKAKRRVSKRLMFKLPKQNCIGDESTIGARL